MVKGVVINLKSALSHRCLGALVFNDLGDKESLKGALIVVESFEGLGKTTLTKLGESPRGFIPM